MNFALANLMWGLGGVIGGLYLDAHRTVTFVTIFLANAALMMSAAAVPSRALRGMRPQRSAPPKQTGTSSGPQALNAPGMVWLCVLTFFVTFIGYGQLQSGIPVFAREVSEISIRTVGFAFGVNTLRIGSLQVWVVRRIDGFRRTRVIVSFGVIWAGAWACWAATGMFPATG
ncbi:hypothetical protein E0H92_27770 [Kribbella speibonae]|uniref:MFS transporter n=1 Tax=Kribbella speibonae TaxID=1572660 RepID=A0A4R0IRL3_9ACTN|nr:hypothetical protein E0H92_27770 [Kribbella speibonae]